VRTPDDLEGFAQLCPDCIGRAGDNGFLRFRLKSALDERARANAASSTSASDPGLAAGPALASGPVLASDPGLAAGPALTPRSGPGSAEPDVATEPDVAAEMVAYYAARAGEYDDWYLRRGRYAHGPIEDAVWNAELDQATLWLDDLPLAGEIVELAAGTGWWSPLLASKGELSIYDAAAEPLDRARDRLLAHRLRAHIHVRDAWAEPDRAVDAVFCGFWLSHIPEDRLTAFVGLIRRWLKPGGRFVFIDSLADPGSGAVDQPLTPAAEAEAGIARRRIADGREFRVVKVHREPARFGTALTRAGFRSVDVGATPRFFVLGTATA
jgi:demethylmenaquinone methyltransferase/2-methoxy-6-polyprenyl-1,4-benzoquinol methylase